jgi:hypothetical protein
MANVFRNKLLRMAILLVPAAVLTGTVFFFAGSHFTEAILPVTYRIVTFLQPKYEFREFRLAKDVQPETITFTLVVRRSLGAGSVVQGLPISGNILTSGIYVISIITLSLLLAWPFLSFRRKLAALLLSLPLLLIAELFDIPLRIIEVIETQSRFIIHVVGNDTLMYHIEMFFCLFLNMGGRQILAILIFLLSIAPFHLKARLIQLHGTVGVNDPCPCGSGRKFKKCCGR